MAPLPAIATRSWGTRAAYPSARSLEPAALKTARRRSDPVGMTPCRATVALLLLLVSRPTSAESPDAAIGGHDEAWWRERHEELVSEVEHLEALVGECEQSEAPPAYDGVAGYTVRGRDGRPRWVQIKRCDEERAALSATRGDLERFEDRARRAGVPPGWLR